MKKLLSTLLMFAMLITLLASCNTPPAKDEPLAIGVMSGPTGMGMAKLMSDAGDESDLYSFEIYSLPATATADLLSGELDMLCLPTNTAATLASQEDVSVLAINTLGSLYLMTDADNEITSIQDLEGKTIYASVPNSTTGPIINYLLAQNGVNATVEFESDHDALVAKVAQGEYPIVVLPEPKVTAALSKNSSYSVDLNLSTEWSKISDTPLTMGCIVARNDSLKNKKDAIDAFLDKYESSIEFINDSANLDASAQMIVDEGILPQLPVAKKSLANLYGSIVYIDGSEMKSALQAFYAAINLSSPSDDFYYEK